MLYFHVIRTVHSTIPKNIMKKTPIRLNTIRPGHSFPNGSTGYILDTNHDRGFEIQAANYAKYGEFYSPGQWLHFKVDENGEGCFQLDTDSKTLSGHTRMCVGEQQPTLLTESEMEWVLDVLKRHGTINYGELKKLTDEDSDVFRLVAFLENAYHWNAFQAKRIEDPWFDQQQWLDALEPLMVSVAV